ncbi:Phosphoenolpyruvate phosphomutase [Streptomyces melanosporofaciens]|uniref:Phosphoenolpyruvate phosphomutase n=1 Tax=Streptomyces melanosporofaciens TaxID=67327 RepID=A0A1H4ZI49_STRMJ|nr:Phosphoenolpyruvate phosphomutase [Streptomyces melanosporofaciens]
MCRAFAPPSGDERFPWSAWEPTLASGLTARMRRGTYYQRPVGGPRLGTVDADVRFLPERTTRRCLGGRMTVTQQAKARLFRSLHTLAGPLALANAWDVASARVIASAGAPAIATTSAGVPWSLGCPDGDALARDQALETISRITAAVAAWAPAWRRARTLPLAARRGNSSTPVTTAPSTTRSPSRNSTRRSPSPGVPSHKVGCVPAITPGGLRGDDEPGHATSSIASHGATATAVGVSPVNALTSRWRWDWST